MREILSHSPEETEAVGAELARVARPGDVILLQGPLGAGKTTLVRGFLRALGFAEPVRSPSFGIMQVYETKPPVLHADLYRLNSADGIGLEDYLDDHVALIEWPERAPNFFGEATFVEIAFEGEGRRIDIKKAP